MEQEDNEEIDGKMVKKEDEEKSPANKKEEEWQ